MEHTPIMKFRVVSDEGTVKISKTIPDNCLFRKIPHAETEYTEGNFGAFCIQLLHTYSATVGWLNFDLNKKALIRPETTKGMVAVCYTLKGNVDCKLQGVVGKVKLIDRNYRFYYIPPESDNKAFFKPGKYDIVYISIKEKYTFPFIDTYPEFKELYERTYKNVMEGLELSVNSISAEELNILREIQEHNRETPDLELFIELKVNELLLIHFKKLKTGIESATTDPTKIAIEKVAKFIEQHLSESYTNKFLSQIAMMNENTLVEEFRKDYEMSPTQYAIKLKMEHAAWLLGTTSLSIADIAVKVGYGSGNYFSTAFKTYHKCPPTDYRKNKTILDDSSINKMKI